MLEKVLLPEIKGDVLELGCNTGTTSIFIRKLLDAYKSRKVFYVYDSFEGLPEKTEHDGERFKRRDVAIGPEHLVNSFRGLNLRIPVINIGWFAEIPDEQYPKKICFAFLDGDFYSSIIDSLNKIYRKLTPGAIVCVHDYTPGNSKWLPGVEKACVDFLKDKTESMQQACMGDLKINGVGFFIKN